MRSSAVAGTVRSEASTCTANGARSLRCRRRLRSRRYARPDLLVRVPSRAPTDPRLVQSGITSVAYAKVYDQATRRHAGGLVDEQENRWLNLTRPGGSRCTPTAPRVRDVYCASVGAVPVHPDEARSMRSTLTEIFSATPNSVFLKT